MISVAFRQFSAPSRFQYAAVEPILPVLVSFFFEARNVNPDNEKRRIPPLSCNIKTDAIALEGSG